MPKSIALLAIIPLFALSGEAQERKESGCRWRFAVVEGAARDRWGVWPEDARQWWNEEGKKKFPELCETSSQDAGFVIEWLRKQSLETHSRTKLDPWISGAFPVPPAYDCYTGPPEVVCGSGPDGQANCYTSPGQTVCTPRPQPAASPEWESYEMAVERIAVTTYRAGKDHFEKLASVTKAGYDASDRPGRASFRSAMKALKKKASGRRRGPSRSY